MTVTATRLGLDSTRRAAALPDPFHLISQRLELSSLCTRDAALYRDLYTDSDTMRFVGPTLPVRQAARSFKAALRSSTAPSPGPLFITIIERASQNSLGLCAIQPMLSGRVETGILLNAAARGRGIATESLRAVMGWGFLSLPVNVIWVRCCVQNHSAERLFATLGLVRQAATAAGEVIWSVDRESWQFKQGEE